MRKMVDQERQVDGNLSPDRELRALRHALIGGVLRSTAIVGLIVAAFATLDAITSAQPWTIPFYWVAYGIVVLLTLWRRAPYGLQVWVVIALLYILGVLDFVEDGPSGSGRAFMLVIPFMASIFLRRRESFWALIASTLTMAFFGLVFSTGALVTEENIGAESPSRWIAGTLALFMLGLLVVVSLDYLLPRLSAALVQTRSLARELDEQRTGLEQAVLERTEALERRSTQLATAAQVAREAAAIRDPEQLLQEITAIISMRFGFYHCGIFLLDETRRYAVLRAASSEGGQRMLARGHRLRVGEVGIVGYVTDRGTPRIALDVGRDAVYLDNPDLPETRSEMALPLRVRGEIIGALDVQSTEPEAFHQEDVAALQTMADQIALAISNAQLFAQVQRSMEAERRAYGEASLQSWRQTLQLGHGLQRRYDPEGFLAMDSATRDGMKKEVRQSRVSVGVGAEKLSVPITVRGTVIGLLDAYKHTDTGPWTPKETELMASLGQQLGIALEDARQRQSAQMRAAREKLTGEVTARIRETLDMETVLRTAVQELRQVLNLPEVSIRLGTPTDTPSVGGNGKSATDAGSLDDEELTA
jgi:GAF domain-containing protein